jgi:hypothetical protein
MKKHFNIQIEENAKIEIVSAYEWYETQKEGLGEIFFIEIQKAPNGYQEINHYRQFPLTNFPFVLLYEIQKETLFIDAVFHTSRNPDKKPKN